MHPAIQSWTNHYLFRSAAQPRAVRLERFAGFLPALLGAGSHDRPKIGPSLCLPGAGGALCGEQQSLLAGPLSHDGAQQAEVEQGCDEGTEGAVQQSEQLLAPVVDRRRKLKFERIPQLVQLFGTRKGLVERLKS
jgi:hypothetical protein